MSLSDSQDHGPSPARGGGIWDLLSVALLATIVVLILATHRTYGITWDELIHLDYGDAVLDYFASAGGDRQAVHHPDHQYGPGYDLLGAAARRISPFGPLETMRLLGGLVGALGMIGVWRLARLVGGAGAGFLGLVFLALTPAYYGQMFSNPKDIPFAVAHIWTLFYVVRIAEAHPRAPANLWVKLALVSGASTLVRIAGAVSLAYIAALAVFLVVRSRASSTDQVQFSRPRRGGALLALQAVATACGAWITLVAFWPWTHGGPLSRPAQAALAFVNHSAFQLDTRLGGESYLLRDLPRSYLPEYFLRQLPEFLLVFAAIAALILLKDLVGFLRGRRPFPFVGSLLAGAVAVLPICVILMGVQIYDGLRQFLFVIPVLCVLAAGAASGALAAARRYRPWVAMALGGGLALAVGSTALSMVRLHPYEYVYFNLLGGGHRGAEGSYDTDYYGQSFRQLCGGLVEYLWNNERYRFVNGDFDVVACVDTFFYELQATPNIRWAGDRRPDFFIGYTRHDCSRTFSDAPSVAEVQRSGRTMSIVRDLRRLP